MNYLPSPVPGVAELPRYLAQELQRISASLKDSAARVFYVTSAENESSLSAGDSANYRCGGSSNVIRVSTSSTVTLTGIADKTANRVRIFVNVGTGVLVLKNAGTESSASHRFSLPQDWNLSANATATLWYDPASARHRGIART